MKKLHALFLLLSTSLFAIHNGNPSEPNMPELGAFISCDDWWGFKLGYEWDYTFDKRVKIRDRKSSVRERFDHYISTSNKGALTFNVSDRFEFYAKLGVDKLELSQRPNDSVRLEYFTDNQLAWYAGGRIILVYWEEMVMGVNALYSGSFMRVSSILENGEPRKTSGARYKYNEWQVGIGFSRDIGPLIPYIGLAYASMHSNLYNIPNDPNQMFQIEDEELENREPFILFLGLGFTKGKNVSLNLESRLLGEKALSLSGNIRF
jgi:major outer membrane protein